MPVEVKDFMLFHMMCHVTLSYSNFMIVTSPPKGLEDMSEI